MEVKVGYKQTEVGIIPEDWKIEPLGELTTLMTNGFVGPVTRHYAENDDGVLYIQGYNVEENSFNFHGIKYVTEEFHRAHMRSCLRTGDLLTIQTGEVGLTTIVPDDLAGSNCHALIISRFDKKYTSPHYVSYYLNSKPGRARLRLIETGTTMKHLNVGDVLHFTIPLPPTIAEQEAIAEALSDADALIEAIEQLIAKKRQIKQGAMQELLTGKRRLSGFSGEWKETALGEMGKIYRGVSYNPGRDLSAFDTNSTIRLLRSNNIQEDTVVFDDMQYVDTSKVSADQIMRENDVLICMANGSKNLVGKAGRFQNKDGYEYTFGAFMGCFRPNTQAVNPDFAFCLFLTEQYRIHISILLAGSSINNLTPTNVEAFVIRIPTDVKEQTAIAEILSDMDAEISALEEKLVKARQVKAGMMSELLTGKIRLV
jgi:type I restriction enzyme S subunit